VPPTERAMQKVIEEQETEVSVPLATIAGVNQ
jgi:hypothetical protein